MKKILSFFTTLFILTIFSSVNAAPGDILYVKESNVEVKYNTALDSPKIATLQAGYVVADLGKYKNGLVYVLLSDNKKGYVEISKLGHNYSNLNKIIGNVGEVRYNGTELWSTASNSSNIVTKLPANTKVEFTHVNYVNNLYARSVVVTGKYTGMYGYIDKRNLNIYNFNYKRNDIATFVSTAKNTAKQISLEYNSNPVNTANSNTNGTNTVIKNTYIEYIKYLKSDFPIKYRAFLDNIYKLKKVDKSKALHTINYFNLNARDIYKDILKHNPNSNTVIGNTPNPAISYRDFSKPVISESDLDYLRNLKITSPNGYSEYHNRLDRLKITDLARYTKIIDYLKINAPELLPNGVQNTITPVQPEIPPSGNLGENDSGNDGIGDIMEMFNSLLDD